mgnify:CR=1 FL=1
MKAEDSAWKMEIQGRDRDVATASEVPLFRPGLTRVRTPAAEFRLGAESGKLEHLLSAKAMGFHPVIVESVPGWTGTYACIDAHAYIHPIGPDSPLTPP